MYSDGDDPAKRERLGMQEALSLDWSRECDEDCMLRRCHWEEQRPFIPVVNGNDAGMGPGKEVSSIMVGMQGEFSMSCFCSVGVT